VADHGVAGRLLWLGWSKKQHRIGRLLGLGLLATMLAIGIPGDWTFPPFENDHFVPYANQFKKAAPGTKFDIPINPDWMMELVKR
jgi:hypothetical protein